jgi:hypothetical protein
VIAAGSLVFLTFALSVFPEITMQVLRLALLLSLVGAAVLAFLPVASVFERRSELLAGLVLLSLLAASLLPIPHFHVSDYAKEQARRANLREVLSYLDTQAPLPISPEGAADWLDVYADFTLGSDPLEQDLPAGRIVEDPTSLTQTGGYRVLYGCGQPIRDFADWPLKEFGQDLGDKTCISLVRVFASDSVLAELAEVRDGAKDIPSFENIQLYLAAAIQAQDLSEAASAFALFSTYLPDETPIHQAGQLFATNGPDQMRQHTTDLLAEVAACLPNCNWSFTRLLTPEMVEDDSGNYLSIGIDRKTDEIQTIAIPVTLKSATAYILQLEMRSFAPFDLVRFDGYSIPDSYPDTWNRVTDWTTFNVVFVTPIWPTQDQAVSLELARVFDRGEIEFRQINLIELQGRP